MSQRFSGRHSHCPAAGPRSGCQAHYRFALGGRLPGRHLRATGRPAGGHYGAALRGTCVFGPGPGRNRLAAGVRLAKRPRHAALPAQYPRFRRHRFGQDHLAQCAYRTPSRKRTHRGYRGYPGVTDRPGQLSPLRGGALGGKPHHHPGAGPARTAAPARSHRSGRGARRRGRRSSAGPQYWSRWVANHFAFQQCRVG